MIDGLSAAVSVLTLQRATRPDRGRNPQLARGLRAGMIRETEHARLSTGPERVTPSLRSQRVVRTDGDENQPAYAVGG